MNRSGLIYALLAAILWGIAPVFEKLGLIHISPLAGLTIRTVSATIILILIMLFTNVHSEIIRADARTVGFLVMSGIVAGLLGMWSYFNAMKDCEASRVVPIVGSYPLFAFLFSLLLLGEQITLQKCLGARGVSSPGPLQFFSVASIGAAFAGLFSRRLVCKSQG